MTAAAHRRIRNRAVAIGISVTPFGFSFGALSVATGFSVLQTVTLSLLLFSGASQFALVSIVNGGGSFASAVSTAWLLGIRNGFYGLRVRQLLHEHGWRRPVAAQLTIDESTAMAVAEAPTEHAARGFWSTGLAVLVLWNLATVAGALAGRGVSSPASFGIDAAGPAAFVALLGPRLRDRRSAGTALLAVAVALIGLPLLPAGAPILVGGAVATLAAAWRGA